MTSRCLAWTIRWIFVLYHEKDNKGTETDLKEETVNSFWNSLNVSAVEIPR